MWSLALGPSVFLLVSWICFLSSAVLKFQTICFSCRYITVYVGPLVYISVQKKKKKKDYYYDACKLVRQSI